MLFEYEVVRLVCQAIDELLHHRCKSILKGRAFGQQAQHRQGRQPQLAGQQSLGRSLPQAQHEQSIKLLTMALLLSGLRVERNVALRIFQGIPMLEESDTYLMILEQGEERGEERATRRGILLVGEERLGAADEAVREQLANITDPERLIRMLRRTVKAENWREILNTL